MQHVKAKGFVHGDIKPGNVLFKIGASGRCHAILTDFGLAQESDIPNLFMGYKAEL